MKIPYKQLLVFLGVILFVASANAQRSSIGLGAELNIPSGNSTNASPLGFGGGLKAELGISQRFSLTANGTVVSFLGKKFFGQRAATLTYLPVKAGLKYYTDRNFYLEGQFGTRLSLEAGGKNAFIWSPGVGSYLKSKRNNNQMDVGFRYEEWVSTRLLIPNGTTYSRFGFFSFRAAYAFNL